MKRCDWCEGNELYINYHDKEWGVPIHDDHKHYEFLVLESMQSGLSWLTILKKRENFLNAFDHFDVEKVAHYNEDKINELMANKGIIRNKRKINAAINNAKQFLAIQKEFRTFDHYIWSFVGHKPIVNSYATTSEIPASSDLSIEISKDLKKRGFKFLGPGTTYSYLQAAGLINDHIETCFRREEVTTA